MWTTVDLLFWGKLQRFPPSNLTLLRWHRLDPIHPRAMRLLIGAASVCASAAWALPTRRLRRAAIGSIPQALLGLLHRRRARVGKPPCGRHRPDHVENRLPASGFTLAQQPQARRGDAHEHPRRRMRQNRRRQRRNDAAFPPPILIGQHQGMGVQSWGAHASSDAFCCSVRLVAIVDSPAAMSERVWTAILRAIFPSAHSRRSAVDAMTRSSSHRRNPRGDSIPQLVAVAGEVVAVTRL